jgi:hypothetical protein
MDFKTTKAYLEAMGARDWQTCELIANEHNVLVKEITELQKRIEFAEECMATAWSRTKFINASLLESALKPYRDKYPVAARASKEIENGTDDGTNSST